MTHEVARPLLRSLATREAVVAARVDVPSPEERPYSGWVHHARPVST
jgi:hypothetical protein